MAIQKAAHTRATAVDAADLPLPARKDNTRAEAKTQLTEKSARPITGGDSTAAAKQQTGPMMSPFDILAYQRDVLERSILFFDTMRKRGNAMLEHEQAGLPALLNFKSEMILDARQFEQPANYALLRITEVGDKCWDDCVDPTKSPVIVIDPRAGHGPGIGGFKRDSVVGIALHVGHPVYFVIFFAEPCPRQTLADVLAALRRFVEHVAKLHSGKAPILYGNCQAGWAATLVSAHCGDLPGPVILNGSPLSYWAGESGVNPMRITAGLVGGVWLTHFLADLGHGQFDGAWLAQGFESLKPGNAMWEKYATLFTHIDTEQQRFLDFERWWNGFYRLSGEEMVAIVENLFVGNKLEQGKVRIDAHCVADLTHIRGPLVIFASYGDNITPPHQALGWIPAVYPSTDALKAAGQRIVFLTNPHVGHLGIFVSAAVARLEHRAILEHLAEIEALEPGLYEMKIDHPTGDPDCARHQYSVRFESRSRYVWSERFMPWMGAFAVLADAVSKNRHALSENHPLMAHERKLAETVSTFWEAARKLRDAAQERTFTAMYGE